MHGINCIREGMHRAKTGANHYHAKVVQSKSWLSAIVEI